MNFRKTTIWQPVFSSGYEIKINLNAEFARRSLELNLVPENKKRLNELASQDLKRFDIDWPEPYDFLVRTSFLQRIYLGRNGVWLNANMAHVRDVQERREKGQVIEYHSHNVRFMNEAYTFLYLFDKGVKYQSI